MTVDRRRALALLGVGAAAPVAAQAQARPGGAFSHGVASGDPTTTGAILWSRWTPTAGTTRPVSVTIVVAPTSESGGQLLVDPVGQSFRTMTDADRDWTIKFDYKGGKPGQLTTFHFEVDGVESPRGTFRTLPEQTEEVVFAVASCSLHPGGLFNAYDAIAKLPGRLDAVVHLGDYIYEYGARPQDYGVGVGQRLGRLPDPPHEIVTLGDYRRRHAQYKSDPNLQAAHARAAWITVWDDHESANDTWQGGAENHDPDQGEGDFATRKANALKAYYEWMPIREPAPGRSADMLDRSFRYGDVATLHMLETRLTARTKQLNYATDLAFTEGRPDLPAFMTKVNAPDRVLLGEAQLSRVSTAVAASVQGGVTWQVLGQQIVMGRVNGPDIAKTLTAEQLAGLIAAVDPQVRPRVEQAIRLFSLGLPYNLDAWDGYPAERDRLYAALKAAGAHPIVLAGDSHAFWVNSLKDGSGARVGAEFGATSITSPGFGDVIKDFDLGAAYAAANDEVEFSDQGAKGFVKLTLTKTEARGELITVSTILEPAYTVGSAGTWRVRPAKGPGVGPLEKV